MKICFQTECFKACKKKFKIFQFINTVVRFQGVNHRRIPLFLRKTYMAIDINALFAWILSSCNWCWRQRIQTILFKIKIKLSYYNRYKSFVFSLFFYYKIQPQTRYFRPQGFHGVFHQSTTSSIPIFSTVFFKMPTIAVILKHQTFII